MNSDRYDQSETTDLNNSPTRYHPTTAFTAFDVYNSACRRNLPHSGLRGGRGVRAVGVASLNANSVHKQRINATSEPSKCSGLAISSVEKVTLGLEWNCGRKARKGHICEDTFAYGSYSSKVIYLRYSRSAFHLCIGYAYIHQCELMFTRSQCVPHHFGYVVVPSHQNYNRSSLG